MIFHFEMRLTREQMEAWTSGILEAIKEAIGKHRALK